MKRHCVHLNLREAFIRKTENVLPPKASEGGRRGVRTQFLSEAQKAGTEDWILKPVEPGEDLPRALWGLTAKDPRHFK